VWMLEYRESGGHHTSPGNWKEPHISHPLSAAALH
jgi:hypothetical protein